VAADDDGGGAFKLDGLDPEEAAAFTRFAERFRATVSGAVDGDDAMVAAMRIIQAVTVAAAKNDAAAQRALAKWERQTLGYMKRHALDEYLRMKLKPRARLDRHLVLAKIKEEIAALLKEQRPDGGGGAERVVVLGVLTIIRRRFRNLEHTGKQIVGDRYRRYLAAKRSPAKVDPELVLIDGLEELGVDRKTAHAWLKVTG
jgi:hypothetical protein